MPKYYLTKAATQPGETYLVLRERDLHAVATDAGTGGTGLYL